MTKIQNWILMVFLSLSMNVWAEIFECKDSQGHIKYQDSECNKTNDERVINFPSGTFVTPYHHKEDESQFKSYSIADNYQQGLEAYQQQNYKKAFSLLYSAANLNHPESQNMLGGMYLAGQGVPKSEQIAFSWFKRSADLGYVTAQTNLAYMYHQGIGCTKDVFLAKEWYQKAIAKGDVRAKKLLAELEKQAAINVEKMQAEAQKYQAVYERIKSPPSPPIEKSSAVSSTIWLVVFFLLAFIVLLTMDRLKKESLTQVTKEFEELKRDIYTPYKLEYHISFVRKFLAIIVVLGAGVFALATARLHESLVIYGIALHPTFSMFLLVMMGVFAIAFSAASIVNIQQKQRNITFYSHYVQLPKTWFLKQKLLSVAYKDIYAFKVYELKSVQIVEIKSSQGTISLLEYGFANQSYFLLFQYLLELGIKKQLPQENKNGQSEANKHLKQKFNDNKFPQQPAPQTGEKYSQKAESPKTESPSQNQSKEESANDRQFKSLLRAIEEQKKTDPLVGAKVGAKEIIQQLLHLLRDNKGDVC